VLSESAAVVAVSDGQQFQFPTAGLTPFVIVEIHQGTGVTGERLYADGRKGPVAPSEAAGELSWQLDTGEFRDLPGRGSPLVSGARVAMPPRRRFAVG
jgi:hypothetical protein